jgi:ADP-ribose pyrophosphatase
MPQDQPANFEVKSAETVFHGKIWDVVRERFDYGNSELTREFVKHTGAVAIIAMDDQQRVLLIRQYRHPVRSYLWEIPAGLLDVEGEPRLEAAKRELHEEAGLLAENWSVLTEFFTTPGGNDELITIYLAQDLKHIGYDEELEGEEADMLKQWFALSDAVSSVLKADIKSPSAIVGIMALALKLGVTSNA